MSVHTATFQAPVQPHVEPVALPENREVVKAKQLYQKVKNLPTPTTTVDKIGQRNALKQATKQQDNALGALARDLRHAKRENTGLQRKIERALADRRAKTGIKSEEAALPSNKRAR